MWCWLLYSSSVRGTSASRVSADLLNPLRSSNDNRPMVIAAGIQPMVIWKKIQQTSLFQPNMPLSNPPAETAPVIETTPAAVVIEMAPATPATPPQEPEIVAAVAPAPIEPNVPKTDTRPGNRRPSDAHAPPSLFFAAVQLPGR